MMMIWLFRFHMSFVCFTDTWYWTVLTCVLELLQSIMLLSVNLLRYVICLILLLGKNRPWLLKALESQLLLQCYWPCFLISTHYWLSWHCELFAIQFAHFLLSYELSNFSCNVLPPSVKSNHIFLPCSWVTFSILNHIIVLFSKVIFNVFIFTSSQFISVRFKIEDPTEEF